MIAGLPLQSWILIALSVGLGLGLELWFYLSYRRRTGAHPRQGSGSPRTSPPRH